MIKLMTAAQEYFAHKIKPGQAIVLGVKRSGCSGFRYDLNVVDTIKSSDFTQVVPGLAFFVDSKSLPYLKGLVIDLEQEGLQSRIVYKNPNETGHCGCGESFSVGESA